MATLTSSNWTITYRNGDRLVDTAYATKKKLINLKLAMVSGSVPATGLKLPSAGSVGLVRNLDGYLFDRQYIASGDSGATVSGSMMLAYNATGNFIKFFRVIKASGTGQNIIPLVTTATIKALNFYVTAQGW